MYLYVCIIIYLFCLAYTGNISDSYPKELTVFQQYYAILCNTVTDIDDLLKYFVSEEIISISEEEEIKGFSVKSEKIRKLLINISGPLKAGDKNGFYVMLKIMKEYGTKATQVLAEKMTSSIVLPSVKLSAENVLKEQHES